MKPAQVLVIDGAHGEGGGQILRSALTLSAIGGRPVRIENLRAGRPRPGLAAQHVTAIRAMAEVCRAEVAGDALGSLTLDFAPSSPPRPGNYHFDVAAARTGGSAGAVSLVLQTILLPLALADGISSVTIRGGTHMAWSPPFDYLRDVWLPTLAKLGVNAAVELRAWGWFPIGKGEIVATIGGRTREGAEPLRPLTLTRPGRLRGISGRAVAANLPVEIARRMAERADLLLAGLECPRDIEPLRVRAACAGAGIFLTAHYEAARCGFSALGKRGKRAEMVAEEVAAALTHHHASGRAFERHLADQVLVPLALAGGVSQFSTEVVTRHLETNAWLIERFGEARVEIDGARDFPGEVRVVPAGLRQT